MATNDDDDDDNNNKKDPFSDWTDLIHKPLYSVDRKIGFLRKTPSGYMVVGLGLVNLTKYFIPESLAESVSKKGIKLKLQPMKHVQSIPM